MLKRQREDVPVDENNARIRTEENPPINSSQDDDTLSVGSTPLELNLADTASDEGGSSAEGGGSSGMASPEREGGDAMEIVADDDDSSVLPQPANEDLIFDFDRALLFIGLSSRLEKLQDDKDCRAKNVDLTKKFAKVVSSLLDKNQVLELGETLQKHLLQKEGLEPKITISGLIDIQTLAVRTVLSKDLLELQTNDVIDPVAVARLNGLIKNLNEACKVLTTLSCLHGQVGQSEVLLVFEHEKYGFWPAEGINNTKNITTDVVTAKYLTGEKEVFSFFASEILPFTEGLDIAAQDTSILRLEEKDEAIVIAAKKIASNLGASAEKLLEIDQLFRMDGTRVEKLSKLKDLLKGLQELPYTLDSCVDAEALAHQIAYFTKAQEEIEKTAKSAALAARNKVLVQRKSDLDKLAGGLTYGAQRTKLIAAIVNEAYAAGKAAADLVRDERALHNKMTGKVSRGIISEASLRSSIEEGSIHEIQSFLLDNEVNWMSRHETQEKQEDDTIITIQSNTLLHIAVERDNREIANLVIEGMKATLRKTGRELKIDEYTNSLKLTALHTAMKKLKVNVIPLLLKYTTDPNKTDHQGYTAMSYLAMGVADMDQDEEDAKQVQGLRSLIDWDESKKDPKILRVERCKADKEGKSALWWASVHEFYALALVMFQNGFRYTAAEIKRMQDDLSLQVELSAIPVVVSMDEKSKPLLPDFGYIKECAFNEPNKKFKGCGCKEPCHLNPNKCSCIANNGQKIPYARNSSGKIVMVDPTNPACECSYLCGCKCKDTDIMRHAQEGQHVQVEVRHTEEKGFGLFAKEKVHRGRIICTYAGCIVEHEELLKPHDNLGVVGKREYLIEVEGDKKVWAVDASEIGNVGRLINHSCVPNVYLNKVNNGHTYPILVFVAIDSIDEGQEIVWKYDRAGKRSKEKREKCKCGHAKCCGWL